MQKAGTGALVGCFVMIAGHALAAAEPPAQFATVRAEDLDWKPIPDGLGATYAIVHGDPSKAGVYAIRVRFPAGIMDYPHSHDQDRHVTVLEGVWHAGTGRDFDPLSAAVLPAGTYMFHPAGGVHFDGAAGDEDAVVQIIGVGPVTTKQEHDKDADWVKVE